MITLKPNEHIKFNSLCGIAYMADYTNPEKYWYVVYAQTYHDEKCILGECFGRGETAEEALKQAFMNLCLASVETINFKHMKDLTLHEFAKDLINEVGCIPGIEDKIVFPIDHCLWHPNVDEVRRKKELQKQAGYTVSNAVVILEKGKVYPGIR